MRYLFFEEEKNDSGKEETMTEGTLVNDRRKVRKLKSGPYV